jgi:hypothetical protein
MRVLGKPTILIQCVAGSASLMGRMWMRLVDWREEAMTTDRTTKVLLALIAVGLWALLLRPSVTGTPGHAAEAVGDRSPEFLSVTATESPQHGRGCMS